MFKWAEPLDFGVRIAKQTLPNRQKDRFVLAGWPGRSNCLHTLSGANQRHGKSRRIREPLFSHGHIKTRLVVELTIQKHGLLMTKSELIEQLHFRTNGLTQSDVAAAANTIIEAMQSTLINGGRVEIRGFGVFGLSYRPPRISRNPKTNEPVNVPGKWMPYFKAGKLLRSKVDYPNTAPPSRLSSNGKNREA